MHTGQLRPMVVVITRDTADPARREAIAFPKAMAAEKAERAKVVVRAAATNGNRLEPQIPTATKLCFPYFVAFKSHICHMCQ